MKIGIIGSGISGLVSAYLLSDKHEVHVFEARDRIGGHTHTVDVEGRDGPHAVDTGFIVFNDWTYPNFIKLMKQLGVESQESSMSFSVRAETTGLEYNPSDLGGLFAQKRNLVKPQFHKMIFEILRFNREAPRLLEQAEPGPTLGEYLKRSGYSQIFTEHYILPMGCAIWSSGTEQMRRFPARYFVNFFHNHGMLSVDDRPTWRVLKGGSRSYLAPICEPFSDNIHLSSPVTRVERHDRSVTVATRGGDRRRFDEVILACHSDQALKMLADPSDNERRLLSAIPYQPNEVVLHTDTSLLPRAKRAWAAWNYFVPHQGGDDVATLTYNMNILQGLDSDETYLVTVNPGGLLDESKVLSRFKYAHPTFLPEGIEAQGLHSRISGVNHTHYAGAYWGYGFHEDGVKSGLRVCEYFGTSL